jgi:hypothetical protein
MSDVATGTLPNDVLNEKVLSCIVEIKVPVEKAEEIIRLVWQVEKEVDTVIVLGAGTRCEDDGDERLVAEVIQRLGYNPQRAKTIPAWAALPISKPFRLRRSPWERRNDEYPSPLWKRRQFQR